MIAYDIISWSTSTSTTKVCIILSCVNEDIIYIQHFSVCPKAHTRTMSESGADRKKRLRAMRDDAEYVDAELKFRNYLPKDEVLLEGQVRGCSSRPTVRRRPTLSSSSRADEPTNLLSSPKIKARRAPEMDVPTVEPENDGDDEVRKRFRSAVELPRGTLSYFPFPNPFCIRQTALLCMLPKKTNHDLKRDVEKKLQRLEKRTQRAMLELMHAK